MKPPHLPMATMNNPAPHFASNLLLTQELALQLALDILAVQLPGFGESFVSEADKLLALPLPTPDAQQAMKTLRDHIAAVTEQGERLH